MYHGFCVLSKGQMQAFHVFMDRPYRGGVTVPRTHDVVRVEGLRDLQRELRAVDTKLPRSLAIANKTAAEYVADRARQRARSQGGVAAKSAPSIRAAGEQRRSKVLLGGPSWPYALGAEFGAKYHPQFKPWRGNQHSEGMQPGSGVGYFLYPTIRDTRDDFMDVYERAIDQVMRSAFPS